MFFQVKGMTLIELMVTVLFVAICAIALVRFQSYLQYDNNLVQQKNEALIQAEKKLEILKDFQVLNNTAGYTSYQGIASGTSTSTGTNTSYSLNWTATTHTNPDYKNLDITVSWTDRYGSTQSVRLISNIAGIDPTNSSIIMGT